MKYYEIKRIRQDHLEYYYKTKNELNQIITISFYSFNVNGILKSWSVELYIGKRKNKSKSFEECLLTGKDGIKSLVWAKKCLEDFILFLTIEKNERNHNIFIYASNSKRMRVYTKSLSFLNFKKGQDFLYKNIINL